MKRAILRLALCVCVLTPHAYARIDPERKALAIDERVLEALGESKRNEVEEMCSKFKWRIIMGSEPKIEVLRFIELMCGEHFILQFAEPPDRE